jgi:hypothetical protein
MKNKAFPISMTVLWGMVFGSAMHSLTMGICMGLMVGSYGKMENKRRQPAF